jgi:P27 family predicted phage terminase small subunit
MRRGRKPTPTAVKRVRGRISARAAKEAADAGLASRPRVPPPPALLELAKNSRARETWEAMALLLWRMGRLPLVSEGALLRYCLDAQLFLEMDAKVGTHGAVIPTKNKTLQLSPFLMARNASADRMARFEAEFGLTPSSTTRAGPIGLPPGAGGPEPRKGSKDAAVNPAAKWFQG